MPAVLAVLGFGAVALGGILWLIVLVDDWLHR